MEIMRSALDRWVRYALPTSLMLAVLALPAFASLGGDVSSVQADQAHMKASTRVSRATNYTVHEMKATGGTSVREFVSPTGQVFGVAWNGPFRPDLQQVLGNYYDQFLNAAKNKRGGHNAPLSINDAGLVIQMSGHQRSFTGRAYVPGMLPQGVAAETVK